MEEQFVIREPEIESLLIDISNLFGGGAPLLQRRVDVLEKQADKYRIMINDLRADIEKKDKTIAKLEERDQNRCEEISTALSEQTNTYWNEIIKLRNSNEGLENHIRELQEKNSELLNTIAEQENEIKSLREKEPVEVTNIERALLNQRLQIYEAVLKSFGVTF